MGGASRGAAVRSTDAFAEPSAAVSELAHSSPTAVTLLNGPLSARGARPVTLRAQTAPSTTCSISIGYVPTPVLAPATADGYCFFNDTRYALLDQTAPAAVPPADLALA